MWYDLLVLVMLGYATVHGARKGIVWQVATIAAVVLCFGFAGSLSLQVAPLIGVEPPLNRWIAMLLLYMGFSFLSFAVARWLRDWIEKARFVEFDRHLGAILGFVKGAVVCLVLTFFSITISDSARETILKTHSGYAAALVMDHLHDVRPDELHDLLHPYIHPLDPPGADPEHGAAGHAHSHDQGRSHDHVADDTGRRLRGRTAEDGDRRLRRRAAHDDAPADSDPGTPVRADRRPDRELREFINTLPERIGDDLRDGLLRTLRNAAPDDRSSLMEKFSTGVPAVLAAIAETWDEGRPAGADLDRIERDVLLQEIAAVYSDCPPTREVIAEEIELLLAGLPDQVELAVLRDWHWDLVGFDSTRDPDPGTGLTTALDVRILRQLDAARVPFATLSAELQDRLRHSLPR